MIKRKDVIPGTNITVVKLMPNGSFAGPSVKEALDYGERFTVLSKPFSSGPLNLVKVKRDKTGESLDVLYAFTVCFCSLSK
jgi:hypothetical protein